MQGCNITESNKPFWIFSKCTQVQILQDPDAAVTTTGKENCPYFRMVQHGLQAFQPVNVLARKATDEEIENFLGCLGLLIQYRNYPDRKKLQM